MELLRGRGAIFCMTEAYKASRAAEAEINCLCLPFIRSGALGDAPSSESGGAIGRQRYESASVGCCVRAFLACEAEWSWGNVPNRRFQDAWLARQTGRILGSQPAVPMV